MLLLGYAMVSKQMSHGNEIYNTVGKVTRFKSDRGGSDHGL